MNSKALQNDIEKVAVEGGVSLFGGLLGKGLFFISQVLLARLLGVEGFGVYALGFAVVKICDIVARLGLNVGGMRFVSIYKSESPSKLKGTLISVSVISFLNAIILSALLFLLSGFIANSIFHKTEMKGVLELFSYSIPFVVLLNIVASLLQGFHILKYTVYSRDIVQQAANIIFIILFYFMGLKLPGVIYAFVLSNLISVVLGFYYLTFLFPAIKASSVRPVYEIRNLLYNSFPLLFVGVIHYLLSWNDTLMLGWLSTGRDVGIYRAAFQIPYALSIFLIAANAIYAPLAADLYQKGEMERLAFILKSITRWITYITVPIFVFIQFSAKEVMVIFGKEYVQTGYIVLIVLSFGQLINCISGSVGYTLTMTGRQKIELINSLLMFLLGFLLNLWLIPKYGALGAAIASCASICLINIARILEVYWIFRINTISKETYRVFLPMLLSIIIMFFVQIIALGNTKLIINILVLIGNFVFYYKISFSDADEFIKDTIKRKILGRTVA